MQKSKHKLESKQKFHHKNNNSTIDTNYETIESQCNQNMYEMKNVRYQDFEMSPEGKVMVGEDEDEKAGRKHNDSVHLEIELDDGKVEIIKPNSDDDPLLLAKNFCRLNQLDQSMISILAKNIQKTIEKLIKINNNQRISSIQSLKNRPAKKNRIHTEPLETSNEQCVSAQILPNEKSTSIHFESISKQFSKKKIQLQNYVQNHNSASSSFNVKLNPLQVNNKNSKSIFAKKPKFKSNKKQAQYDSIKTQKSLKTESNQSFKNNPLNYLKENKENQSRQKVFDYPNSNNQKKAEKQSEKLQCFLRRNCGNQSKAVKNIQKRVVDSSFQKTENQRKNENKESQKRKCFTKSIGNSSQCEDKHISLKNNRRSPLANYSLVNLSTNSKNTSQSYHRKQVWNSIIQNSNASSNHVLQTHRLYENQKQKAFRSIFALLDDDEDGVISIVNINLVEKVQQRLIQVLFPVLEEMQILETQLNEQEFIQAMEKLFIKLTVEQKGYLLKYLSKQQQDHNKQNITTNQNQSKMSSISLQLVNQTERRNVTVYEYSKIREQQRNKKLEQQRVEKERNLMRNCTFHPKVNSKKNIYF